MSQAGPCWLVREQSVVAHRNKDLGEVDNQMKSYSRLLALVVGRQEQVEDDGSP